MTESSAAAFYQRQAMQLRVAALSTANASRKVELLALALEFEKLAEFAENNLAVQKLP